MLSYIRTTDGFLTAMHDVAPSAGTRHRVAVFNPGSNRNQESLLRLINPGDQSAEVKITGIDDKGAAGTSAVSLSIPVGGTRTVGAWDLESGAEGLDGALGDGAGKWQLTIESDSPVTAMSLLRSPTGHLTNLSTAPSRGARGGAGAGAQETAEDVFRDSVSPIVQSKCVNCHVEGGASGNTRLVFVTDEDAEHLTKNLSVFETFLAEVEDGADLILNKIQGVSHGGGIQVAAGTDEFSDMERFLSLLGEDTGAVAITPATLFDGVRMESWRSTLRRAAIVFAGRIPTEEEYGAIKVAGLASKRQAIRGLMQGRGFHDFLIRGSNDRLLTDRDESVIDATASDDFVDFANLYYDKVRDHYESGGPDQWQWYRRVQYGVRRAPLELIAHVVENDLSYTEVLTADYIMANPLASVAYGASTVFRNADDDHEFRPSEIASYYRDGPSKVSEFFTATQLGSQAMLVKDPGDLATDYPHAGILNTTVFLLRYPTTATNRNRARSRWTYYHFLGLDVEKSASRTTDPVALADTANPTMHNPACTVCHSVLDPVAGAFQNYGTEGFYRDQWGGLDSLDGFYREDRGIDIPVEADDWGDRETLAWTLTLSSGANDLAVDFTNDFYDEETGDDGFLYLDRLRVVGPVGEVVEEVEFEDVGAPMAPWGPCGGVQDDPAGQGAHLALVNGGSPNCTTWVEVDVAQAGTYQVEVVAWADRFEENENWSDWKAEVAVSVNAYREGDTWYRDMRRPGFNSELVPDADRSLPWLAERIVADERFAEATVKFWWPAVMGADVAAPPSEGDPGFEGRLLASNAQSAEVERLARGFRRGFGEGVPYNLKDLLIEIALSRWFRADSVADADPARVIALEGAGARRLLTPEELSRKTVAITGFDWGRRKSNSWNAPAEALNWTNTERQYGLLYGGIDSDGITKRGRDLTSIMAGVAKRHSAAVSCPVVMKDFYLLDDGQGRLFSGIDRTMTPVIEFAREFEVEADSWGGRETLRLSGPLEAGLKTVGMIFTNNDGDDEGDRNIRLYQLRVRNAEGELVEERSLKDLEPPVASWGECGHASDWNPETGEHDHFNLHSSCGPVEVEIQIPAGGTYTIEIVTWADQFGDELAQLEVFVDSDTVNSVGARAIRAKLVELHDKLLGVEVDDTSPEVQAAFDLFVEVWRRGRDSDESEFRSVRCDFGEDHQYFDGILDDIWATNEYGDRVLDWERINSHLDAIDWGDRRHVARSWVVVLSYLMTDYRYLHL